MAKSNIQIWADMAEAETEDKRLLYCNHSMTNAYLGVGGGEITFHISKEVSDAMRERNMLAVYLVIDREEFERRQAESEQEEG